MADNENHRQALSDICVFPAPSLEEWEEAVKKTLKGKTAAELHHVSEEGLDIKPLYTNKDRPAGLNTMLSGDFPYTRGSRAFQNQKKPWEIVQRTFERLPEKVNEEMKEGMKKGQDGSDIGINRGFQRQEKAVSATGVCVSSTQEASAVLEGIDVGKYTIALHAEGPVLPFFSIWISALRQNEGWKQFKGSITVDPLSELAETGSLATSLDTAMDQTVEILKWQDQEEMDFPVIRVSSETWHNNGADMAQELAALTASGVYYVNELLDRGVSLQKVLRSLVFHMPAGGRYFPEMAKLRAARLLWANAAKAFGAANEECRIELRGSTSKRTKTVYDPFNNMLRGSIEGFAAAAGGVDVLHIAPFDEVIQKPSSFASRIARNTQIILQEEAHIGKTMDAPGGSFYVETLTEELAEKAWTLFQEIEKEGGIASALASGFIQKQTEASREVRLKQIEERKKGIIGVNMYPNDKEKTISAGYDDEKEINKYNDQMHNSSKRRKEAVSFKEAVQLAEQGFSLWEIAGSDLSENEGLQVTAMPLVRDAERFENLRTEIEAYSAEKESLSLLVLGIGPLASCKPRMDFAAGFLKTGGYSIITIQADTIQEAEKSAEEHNIPVVLCGSDEQYKLLKEENLQAIKKNAGTLMLAGEDSRDIIDLCLNKKKNVYQSLAWLREKMGGKAYAD
ncbi:heterodimeric methylmalonyl-CoA mutase small subunit [Sinobaca qinghaiensis]|uniref:Heterodimeric methylmalonyl-CoA mutase small subunit n=2 Tax=Sinobaca qinghaiensis TaxID=342944 RepID=A0A419V6R1_9BACL|nr:heterodimeric methylmalonyl-CoA mutase small subunit [Sinobaca qinghaiensis]